MDKKSIKKSIIFFESNLEPTWGQLGPTYWPLGPNLAQLGANLGPTWAHLGSKIDGMGGWGGPQKSICLGKMAPRCLRLGSLGGSSSPGGLKMQFFSICDQFLNNFLLIWDQFRLIFRRFFGDLGLRFRILVGAPQIPRYAFADLRHRVCGASVYACVFNVRHRAPWHEVEYPSARGSGLIP